MTLAGLATLMLLAGEYLLLNEHARQDAQEIQQLGAEVYIDGVEHRLNTLLQQASLLAMGTVNHPEKPPSSSTLNLISREIIHPDSDIIGISLVSRVLPAERPAFEASVSTPIRIKAGQGLKPSPSRLLYFPVEAALPNTGAAPPLGLDLGSNPGWTRSLEWSRNTGRPVVLVDYDLNQQPASIHIAATVRDSRWFLLLSLNSATLVSTTLSGSQLKVGSLRLIAWEAATHAPPKMLFDSRPGQSPPIDSPLLSRQLDLGAMRVMLCAYAVDPVETREYDEKILAYMAGSALLAMLVLTLLYRFSSRLNLTRHQLHDASQWNLGLEQKNRDLQAECNRFELATLESQTRQQAILQASTDAIILIDRSGTIINANPAAAALAGQSDASLVGLPVGSLLPELYDVSGVIQFAALADALGRQPFEGHLIRHDNSSLSIELSLSHVTVPDEPFYLAVCRDISLRKEKEAALISLKNSLAEQVEIQRSQLTALLEASPLAMAYIVDRKLKQVNQAFLDVFQCDSEDQIIDQSTLPFFESEEQWLRTGRALYNLLNEGKVVKSELRLVTRRKQPFWCRLYGKALNPSVPGLGTVWLYQDFSSDRAAEDALRAAKELAEETSRAKTEFLANMSHELRTPMHAILGFAEMGQARLGQINEERLRHYFERIHTSGSRLLNLLNDLLDLAKMEVGRMEYHFCRHDMRQVLIEACDELAHLAAGNQLQLRINALEAPSLADMDPLRIGQVIRNLLSNAIKFSPPERSIDITLDFIAVNGERHISVSVADRGPGIPPGELESIFDKFIQSSATKTGAGGTGLGLAICREIIHAHQGEIRAFNAPEGGALFRFTFPCQAPLSTEETEHGT